MTRVLIVDDAPDYARLFSGLGYEVGHAPTIRRAEALIGAGQSWDVAFIDFELEDKHTGLTAFALIADMPQPPATVAFTVFKRSGGPTLFMGRPGHRKVQGSRDAGYGYQAVALDGQVHLAARHLTTTGPLIRSCEPLRVHR